MKNELDVIVVGSLNMDMFFHTSHIPMEGETILGGSFITTHGGKGANQAVALARLGRKVGMVGRVGDDPFGRSLIEGLKGDQVDTRLIRLDPEAATGVALILVEPNGKNRIVVASGANLHLEPKDLEGIKPLIHRAKVLLMQLEIPLETVIHAVEIARQSQTQVVLNPAPSRPLPPELLRQVDILIPNEVEAAMLVESSQSTDAADVAAQLLEMGPKTVLITLGEAGALLMNKGGAERIPGFEVEVVDTTAAGDAFIGGFVAALTEGRTLRESVRWGNAAGALACIRLGAQPSLPTREEVLHLLSM